MPSRRTLLGLMLVIIAGPVLLLVNPGLHDIANRSVQYELAAFGANIYGYHDKDRPLAHSGRRLSRHLASAQG